MIQGVITSVSWWPPPVPKNVPYRNDFNLGISWPQPGKSIGKRADGFSDYYLMVGGLEHVLYFPYNY